MDINLQSSIKIPKFYEVNNAVLVVAFNRPNETQKVLNQLRQVKPKKIYFAVDGPRAERTSEDLLVNEVRELVSAFDWECTLNTRFLDENLGCGLGVSSAISWALESEESVINLMEEYAAAEKPEYINWGAADDQ
jgi:hypothetical protein